MFLTLFHLLGETWKELNEHAVYILNSYPIATCDNYRVCRSCRYQGEVWWDRQASKKRFFYGLKIHIIVTEFGRPVKFLFSPVSISDTSAYRLYDFDLPPEAWITADKAYITDYDEEDSINEAGMRMKPMRKSNSKRSFPLRVFCLQSTYRKIVETMGSMIGRLLPKSIPSVTAKGFELKISLFVLAERLNFLWSQLELISFSSKVGKSYPA